MEYILYDEQYNYEDISYNSIIISLLIIYSTTISVILFFIKQPKEVIKEVIKEVPLKVIKQVLMEVIKEEEELLATEEEELLATEEEELLATEEEELLATEEEELLATEEEEEEFLSTEEDELIATEKNLLLEEEEKLLANYNTKERALALQEAYKEKLDILLKKKNEINTKLDTFNKSTYNLFFNTDSSGLPESVINKILLLRMIHVNISQSITKELPSNEEILRIAKKAGVIESPYNILELLKINTNTFDTVKHPFYDDYKDVLSKI
jgi:hypothetical protein